MADGARSTPQSYINWANWVRLRELPAFDSSEATQEISVVDLFSGCGGMTLGVSEAARQMNRHCKVKLAVDFNKSAIDVYRDNFDVPKDMLFCCDIMSVFSGAVGDRCSAELRSLALRVGKLDVLVAGPPCQGHSDLNNYSRRSDPRNNLYLSAVRAVEVLAPSFVVIENVPAVVHDRENVVAVAAELLSKFGYKVYQDILNVSEFGVPQMRKRHVTLASKVLSVGEMREFAFDRFPGRISTVKEFIGDLENMSDIGGVFNSTTRLSQQNSERIEWLFENNAYDLPDLLRPPCHRDRPHSYRSMYGRMHWERPAQTITTGFGSMGQGRYVHPSKRRMITSHEAARLQGFPDFFKFGACSLISELREMIGNAVPPQFAAGLIKAAFRG